MRLPAFLLLLTAAVTAAAPAAAQWTGPTVLDINKTEAGSHPSHLTWFGERVYFRASLGTRSNFTLYGSSGAPGEYAAVVVPPGFESRGLRPDLVVGDRLLLTTYTLDAVLSMTTDGTFEVLLQGSERVVRQGTVAGGVVYSQQSSAGVRLWFTDGTPTGRVAITPSPLPGRPLAAAFDDTSGVLLQDVDGQRALWEILPEGGGARLLTNDIPAETSEIALTGRHVIIAGSDMPQGSNWAIHRETGAGTSPGAAPTTLTTFDDRVLAESQTTLQITDGTAGGTHTISTLPAGQKPKWLAQASGVQFFVSGSTGGTGRELWRTDGTPDGTFLVGDLNPGQASSSPGALRVHDGLFYFHATSAQHGQELWVSDGTSAGTRVIDINPGPASSNACWAVPAPGGSLLVSASVPAWGQELLDVNPESGRVELVANLETGATLSSNIWNLTGIGSQVAFSAVLDDQHLAIHTDGSDNGTGFFGDYRPSHQVDLYFHTTQAGEVLALEKLWGEGTSAVWHLGSGQPALLASSVRPGNLGVAEVGDRIVVQFTDGVYGGRLGTGPLDLISPGNQTPFTHLTQADGHAYFRSFDSGEWYFTDGTASGTHPVPGSASQRLWQAVPLGDALITIEERGGEVGVWVITPGASPVALASGHRFQRYYWTMKSLGDRVIFFEESPSEDVVPWVTFGTLAGTYRLNTPGVQPRGGPRSQPMAAGDRVFISVGMSPASTSLWVTDASQEARAILSTDRFVPLNLLTALDGELLFAYDDGVHGIEPWITQGDSTRLFADLIPGPESSYPRAAVRAGDRLFVSATTADSDRELLVFRYTPDQELAEGTPVPQHFVSEVYPNPAGATAQILLRTTAGGAVNLAIYDLLGRQVVRINPPPVETGQTRVSLPTGSLAPGVYFLRISDETQAQVRRFVVAGK